MPRESAIREQLERILASSVFSRSRRMSAFLRFVVEETLQGRAANLKEQVLAGELYGKGTEFDTAVDSVVRVDARRLRDKLREYYSVFNEEPVVIFLPKGTYVPTFEFRAGRAAPRVWPSGWKIAAALSILAAGAWWVWRARPARTHGAAVAVLPLENLSPDLGREYLADAMTDELITGLAKVQALRVVSRTSVLRFKRTHQPIAEIAAALGVDYLVEGTILPAGDRVRVTAQLIAVTNERHVWAEIYERNQRDVPAIENEIASSIASRLGARPAPNARRNGEAVDAYMKGRFQWNKRTPEALRKSLEYFKQAVALDPGYALAWSGLADSYAILANRDLLPPAEAFPLSRAAAQKALQLDDGLAEAHAAMANSADGPVAAEPEFARAVALNPSYAVARQWHAENLMFLGRMDEALFEIGKAIELDPLSPLLRAVRAKIFYYAGRYDDAIRSGRQALEMEPGIGGPGTSVVLSLAYARKGRYAEAIAELKAAGASDGDSPELKQPEVTAVLGYVYVLAGRQAAAKRILVRLGDAGHIQPYAMAGLTAGLGRKDDAFSWLAKAYAGRDNLIYMLKVDPDLASLRPDPRYESLLRKLRMN